MIYIYDFEVFSHDWLVVFKCVKTGEKTIIHNDNESVAKFMSQDNILLCGFNNKGYDNHILKAVLLDFTPEQIKELSDFIISGNNGWDYPLLQGCRIFFDNFDLTDDMQDGISLKAFEAHMGMSIVESSVDFKIDRHLTDKELEETIKYCCYDTDATEELMHIRTPYLKTKIKLGNMRDIPEAKSIGYTNATLVAKYLQATYVERTDGRDYKHPKNLNLDIIPKPIIDFFETIRDLSIPDEELFKTFLCIDIAGCPSKYAWGGVHGAPSYTEERNGIYTIKKARPYHAKTTSKRLIKNKDVTSLYPSLMILYDCYSRNIASKEIFVQTYDERIAAKKRGDKEVSNTLKLPLNTASGCGEAKFNPMYDPLPTRSMRIYGQLFLTDLVMNIKKVCPSFLLINFNTDGIMYEIDAEEDSLCEAACEEWQHRTGFELETDNIKEFWQKDVNNLLIVKDDGSIKKVGSYLNYGINTKGAFSINNNYTIVKDALIDYFVKGVPIEETINNCNEILKFQMIAKAGSYGSAYHEVGGEKVAIQKVNRVYATKDRKYGTIKKFNKLEEKKVESIPLHCVIDNDNKLEIKDVDKTWYIRVARNKVNEFLGFKVNKRKTSAIWRQIKKILEVN